MSRQHAQDILHNLLQVYMYANMQYALHVINHPQGPISLTWNTFGSSLDK